MLNKYKIKTAYILYTKINILSNYKKISIKKTQRGYNILIEGFIIVNSLIIFLLNRLSI